MLTQSVCLWIWSPLWLTQPLHSWLRLDYKVQIQSLVCCYGNSTVRESEREFYGLIGWQDAVNRAIPFGTGWGWVEPEKERCYSGIQQTSGYTCSQLRSSALNRHENNTDVLTVPTHTVCLHVHSYSSHSIIWCLIIFRIIDLYGCNTEMQPWPIPAY